jgi:hypothetical protein
MLDRHRREGQPLGGFHTLEEWPACFCDPKPVPLRIGRQHRGHERKPRNEQVPANITSLIRLSHLAPEIVGALLAGRHPIELTPTRLLRLSKNLPHDWKEQRGFLGFAA